MAILCLMSLEDWANLSQIGQFVLVLVSLVAIWYQLRQSVQLAKAANSQSFAEQAGSFNSLLIQSSEVAKIWYSYGKGFEKEELQLPMAEARYKELLIQWLILHENIYYQNQKHLLDPTVYNSWETDLRRTVKRHNLEVFETPLEQIFCGPFGEHLKKLRQTNSRVGESSPLEGPKPH